MHYDCNLCTSKNHGNPYERSEAEWIVNQRCRISRNFEKAFKKICFSLGKGTFGKEMSLSITTLQRTRILCGIVTCLSEFLSQF